MFFGSVNQGVGVSQVPVQDCTKGIDMPNAAKYYVFSE